MLLAQISGESMDAPALSLADLVEQSLGEDPLAVPLASALRKRAAGAVPEPEDHDTGIVEDPELADLLARLYGELELLRRRNQTLAEALGACPSCWGEDELCAVCRGRGGPGGRRPQASLFAELVEPALRRLGAPFAEARRPVSMQAHQT